MKKAVKLTEKVKRFIYDKMAEGYDVAQICRAYPDRVPEVKTIYKAQAKDPSFSAAMDEAYTILLMRRIDDLEEVVRTPSSELFPDIDDPKERSEAKRLLVDSRKFVLGKMAPILSKRFDKVQRVEVDSSKPLINVIKYYGEDAPKLEKDVTPAKE